MIPNQYVDELRNISDDRLAAVEAIVEVSLQLDIRVHFWAPALIRRLQYSGLDEFVYRH